MVQKYTGDTKKIKAISGQPIFDDTGLWGFSNFGPIQDESIPNKTGYNNWELNLMAILAAIQKMKKPSMISSVNKAAPMPTVGRNDAWGRYEVSPQEYYTKPPPEPKPSNREEALSWLFTRFIEDLANKNLKLNNP